jgi:hypothetical protein
VVSLIVSAAATAVLFVGAAMADGACHCMTSMFTLFPYGSFVMMHFSSDSFGLPLALLQFPVYAVVLTLVKGMRWKVGILLLLIALHVVAASFSLRDYCQSRRTCFLERHPTSACSGLAMSEPLCYVLWASR